MESEEPYLLFFFNTKTHIFSVDFSPKPCDNMAMKYIQITVFAIAAIVAVPMVAALFGLVVMIRLFCELYDAIKFDLSNSSSKNTNNTAKKSNIWDAHVERINAKKSALNCENDSAK